MKKKSSKTKAKGKVSMKDLTLKSVKGAGVKGGRRLGKQD